MPSLLFYIDQGRPIPRQGGIEQGQSARYSRRSLVDTYARLAKRGLVERELALFARGHLASRRRVLDVGCGCGREAIAFTERGALVTAVDVSEQMIAKARSIAGAAPIDFRVAGLSSLSFLPRSFDAVYLASDVYHRVAGRAHRVGSLARVRDLLVPGGTLVVVARSRPDPWYIEWFLERPRQRLRRHCSWLGEPGDRLYREVPGNDLHFHHLFGSDDEIRDEIADAGFRVIDHDGGFWVARSPGGDQRYGCNPTTLATPLDDDLILADLDTGVMHRLNCTARMMWERLEQGETVEQMAEALSPVLAVPTERLIADAQGLIAELLRLKLIRVNDATR
jgi:SAM-dependent methyltransferase